jgi:hypothetical protein
VLNGPLLGIKRTSTSANPMYTYLQALAEPADLSIDPLARRRIFLFSDIAAPATSEAVR